MIAGIFDPAIWFGLATVVAFFVIIEFLVQREVISSLIIALPSESFMELLDRENLGELGHATGVTMQTVVAAMVIEVFVAVPLGYFLYRNKLFGLAYESWLSALFAAPIFLLYPLFMVVFGRSQLTLVMMGVAAGIVPIIVYVRLAFMTVPTVLIKAGQSYGLTEFQIFRMIMVPSGAPTMFTGIRLSLIYTLINIIAIEYLVDIGGLGRLVSDRYFRFDISGTYAAIFAVAGISVAFNVVVSRLEALVKR